MVREPWARGCKCLRVCVSVWSKAAACRVRVVGASAALVPRTREMVRDTHGEAKGRTHVTVQERRRTHDRRNDVANEEGFVER